MNAAHNGELLRSAARLAPRLPAVIVGEHRLSFAELHERSCRLVSALGSLGIHRQDRVAVLGPNSHRTMEIITGLALGGFTRVHLHYGNTAEQHRQMLRDSGARIVIADGDSATELDELFRSEGIALVSEDGTAGLDYEQLLAAACPADLDWPVEPDDIALLGYTGGTTGPSTGTVQTQRTWFDHTVENLVTLPPLDDQDVCLVATALAGAPSSYIFPCIARLVPTVIAPAFDAGACLALIARHRVSLTVMLPAMLQELIAHPDAAGTDLSSLRAVFVVGTPMAERTLRDATRRLGDVISFGYGQSECAPVSILTPRDVRRGIDGDARILRSVGRVTPRGDIRIVDEQGHPVPTGVVGEAQVRAAGTMRGYWGIDSSSKFTPDGWVRSGDVGRVDADGFIFIAGRMADRIVLADRTLYPSVLEDRLQHDPAIAEVVVTGPAEELTVHLHVRAHAEQEPVAARVREVLLAEGLGRAAVVFAARPFAKSPAGKILRREVTADQAGSSSVASH